MGREIGVLQCFCGDSFWPSLGCWCWKWVPAALLHPDRPACSFHNPFASRRREDGGNPFLGAPEQLRGRQSRKKRRDEEDFWRFCRKCVVEINKKRRKTWEMAKKRSKNFVISDSDNQSS